VKNNVRNFLSRLQSGCSGCSAVAGFATACNRGTVADRLQGLQPLQPLCNRSAAADSARNAISAPINFFDALKMLDSLLGW
jgi:hypothetical protein